MKCANHPKTEAVGTCTRCARPFCDTCAVDLEGRLWCKDCLVEVLTRAGAGQVHPGWRKLAAGLLSIFPGAGHMFLGLIGKGFTLMGLLILAVFLVLLYSDATGMYWLTAYLVPALGVLFLSYAVFDALAIADERLGRGSTARGSGSGREPFLEDQTMKAVWERVLLNRWTIGWVVLVAGAVGVLKLFSEPFSRWTRDVLSVSLSITGLVIPIVLLILGIVLLAKGRTRT
jgi:hypothetical protein